ncbi:MAG: [Fe-Fe] hydrogenase large subunit C-terminal domain-containing protein [archaeon]|jgi:iron only hydrogenase large subunit-like protein
MKEAVPIYSEDQLKVLSLLSESKKKNSKIKLYLMVAPSFVVDFDYLSFVPLMKSLGFDKVTELTFGAKIVNQHYHKYIKEHYTNYIQGKKKDKNFQEKFIASVCPSSVELIKNRYPELKKYLLPFDSPMGAMAKVIRKNFPTHKIIFLSPCSAKKFEAKKLLDKKGKVLITATLTFEEMKKIISNENPVAKKISHKFDSFYNDYTKIYPLAGGLGKTLHAKDILKESEMVACDGCKDIMNIFNKNSNKVFYDLLFCSGGCIGGPGVKSGMPIFLRKLSMKGYVSIAKKENMDGKRGKGEYAKGIDFSKEF